MFHYMFVFVGRERADDPRDSNEEGHGCHDHDSQGPVFGVEKLERFWCCCRRTGPCGALKIEDEFQCIMVSGPVQSTVVRLGELHLLVLVLTSWRRDGVTYQHL